MKAKNRVLNYLLDQNEALNGSHGSVMHANMQLRSTIDTLQTQLQEAKSKEGDEELLERVHDMTLNKHVKVYCRLHAEMPTLELLDIESVHSSAGVTTITVTTPRG